MMTFNICSICQNLKAKKDELVRANTTRKALKKAAECCPACDMIHQAFECHPLLRDIDADEGVSLLTSWTKETESLQLQGVKQRLMIPLGWQREGDIEFYTTDKRVAQNWQLITLGNHVSADSSSIECLTKARHWIDECVTQHGSQNCPSTIGGNLPTRVIDVGNGDIRPRLYEPQQGETGTWAALSYCWGPQTAKRFVTTSSSLSYMKNGFNLDEMPRTCRDAVIVARGLDVRYLWIDAMCIIQDSVVDWERESAQMCNIYENALVVFAAVGSLTSDSGLFHQDPCRTSCKVEIRLPSGEAGEVFVREAYFNEDSRSLVHGPSRPPTHEEASAPSVGLNTRAWTFQETLISPRVLWFHPYELSFSCRSLVACECTPFLSKTDLMTRQLYETKQRDGPGGPYELDLRSRLSFAHNFNWMDQWNEMIETYTRRDLTYVKDRLPALSGIAAAVQKHSGSDYFAGMWEAGLDRQLLWGSRGSWSGNEIRSPLEQLVSPGYAPSWSWASLSQYVSALFIFDHLFNEKVCDRLWTCGVVKAQFTPTSTNTFGPGHGMLRLRSAIVRLKLSSDFSEFRPSIGRDASFQPLEAHHHVFGVIGAQFDPRDDVWTEDQLERTSARCMFVSTHVFKRKTSKLRLCAGLIVAPTVARRDTWQRIGISQIILDDNMWKHWQSIGLEDVYLA